MANDSQEAVDFCGVILFFFFKCIYIYICTQDFSQHQLANLFSYSNGFYLTMLISHIYFYSLCIELTSLCQSLPMLTISKGYQIRNHI